MELQFENKSIQYLRPILRESKELEQTQEVRLPEGMPDIGSILGVWGQCVMRSKEWNGDHFIVSGGVMAWVLYAPADGSAPRSMETWLPIQMKWNMGDGHNTGHIRCQWLLNAVGPEDDAASQCIHFGRGHGTGGGKYCACGKCSRGCTAIKAYLPNSAAGGNGGEVFPY